MKTLGNLRPAAGSNVQKKRKGRGIGSGLGKTSGKGMKGQLARKGPHIRPGFEGGQMPLYRRLPKRGFNPLDRVTYNVVNLENLGQFASGTVVTAELLEKAGLLRNPGHPIKLLGRGTIDKKLTVAVNKASAAAKEAVEKAGGKVEEI